VAAHGGVPPHGPLLRVLDVEVIIPRPRFSFICRQNISVGSGIFGFRNIDRDFSNKFLNLSKNCQKNLNLSKVLEYWKFSFGIKF
jgi:hypothetical protein